MPVENELTARLWHAWIDRQDKAAFHRLCELYLPRARFVACGLKRRKPDFYSDPIDELIADGVLGVMGCIRNMKAYAPQAIPAFMNRCIRQYIVDGVCGRHWAGKTARLADAVIANARAALVVELGRMPERAELLASVARSIKNPAFYIDLPRHRGQSSEDGKDVFRGRASDAPAPDQRAINADIRRLAFKAIKDPIDRKILRRILRGDSQADIAREFGITRQYVQQRLNGALWSARMSAELAEHAQAQPAKVKPLRAGRPLPAPAQAPALRAAC